MEPLTWRKRERASRLAGRRFTLDAAVMQQLVFNKGQGKTRRENGGCCRMCWICRRRSAPDGAGHSDCSRAIRLTHAIRSRCRCSESSKGSAGGAVVSEPLCRMAVHAQSLLEEKGDGYPSFMTTDQLADKSAGNLCRQLYRAQARHGTLCQAGYGGDGRWGAGGAG